MFARRIGLDVDPRRCACSVVLCMTGCRSVAGTVKRTSPRRLTPPELDCERQPSQAELQDPAKRKALIDKMIARLRSDATSLATHSRQSATPRRCLDQTCHMSSSRPT